MTKKKISERQETRGFHDKKTAEKMLCNLIASCNKTSRFFVKLDIDNKGFKNKYGKAYAYKCENNRKYLKQKFVLKDVGIEHLVLELAYEYSNRIFGRADTKFRYDGRFYGPVHQNINKYLRQYIQIDGESTVEPDFSSLHPRMLYHQQGIDYRDDVYAACGPEYLRKTFKRALLIAINAKNEQEAMNSLRSKMIEEKLPWPEEKKPIRWIIDRIKEVHQPIAHMICSDAGIKLMRKDADIMNAILMRLMRLGICGLSVHDSVIVADRHRDTLYLIMDEEYEKAMGYKPVIDG